HDGAADHVRMAVQIFGGRVHDDVETALERPLEVGAGEGVVGDRKQATPAGEGCPRLEGDDAQERVGWRFHPEHACRWPDGGRDGGEVGEIDESRIEPGRTAPHPIDQAEGAAVEVVSRDDMGARVEKLEYGGNAGEPGREGEAGGTAL